MQNLVYFEAAARQCEFVNNLILEAGNSKDLEKTIHLCGLAREETKVLSKSLRQFLSKTPSGQVLNAA